MECNNKMKLGRKKQSSSKSLLSLESLQIDKESSSLTIVSDKEETKEQEQIEDVEIEIEDSEKRKMVERNESNLDSAGIQEQIDQKFAELNDPMDSPREIAIEPDLTFQRAIKKHENGSAKGRDFIRRGQQIATQGKVKQNIYNTFVPAAHGLGVISPVSTQDMDQIIQPVQVVSNQD